MRLPVLLIALALVLGLCVPLALAAPDGKGWRGGTADGKGKDKDRGDDDRETDDGEARGPLDLLGLGRGKSEKGEGKEGKRGDDRDDDDRRSGKAGKDDDEDEDEGGDDGDEGDDAATRPAGRAPRTLDVSGSLQRQPGLVAWTLRGDATASTTVGFALPDLGTPWVVEGATCSWQGWLVCIVPAGTVEVRAFARTDWCGPVEASLHQVRELGDQALRGTQLASGRLASTCSGEADVAIDTQWRRTSAGLEVVASVRNQGRAEAQDVLLRADLPEGVWTVPDGCIVLGSSLACDLGDIAPGAEATVRATSADASGRGAAAVHADNDPALRDNLG